MAPMSGDFYGVDFGVGDDATCAKNFTVQDRNDFATSICKDSRALDKAR